MRSKQIINVVSDSGVVVITKRRVGVYVEGSNDFCAGCDIAKLRQGGLVIDCPRVLYNNLACIVEGSFENFVLQVVGVK